MKDKKTQRDSQLLISLAKFFLPILIKLKYGKLKLEFVDNGLELIKNLQNERLIFCLNHPSAADVDVVFAFSKSIGEDLNFLTARELFRSRGGKGNFLSYLGCYSVNRGKSDFKAYRTTKDLLVKGETNLAIFPEGEVSHREDSLLPLKAGAVQIGFAALSELRSMHIMAPLAILPVALKYNYDCDIKQSLNKSIGAMETKLGIHKDNNLGLLPRIRNLTDEFLRSMEQRYDCRNQSTSFSQRVQCLQLAILYRVSKELGIEQELSRNLVDQVHSLQSVLYELRWQEKENIVASFTEKRSRQLRSLATDLHHCLNLMSVCETCFKEPVSQDKIAILLEAMESDLLRRVTKKGPITVYCAVGRPINLADYFQDYKNNKEDAVDKVNHLLADNLCEQIQKLELYGKHISI